MADTAEKVPLHIKIVPHVGDVQIQILVEIAIQLMKFTKGELNPDTFGRCAGAWVCFLSVCFMRLCVAARCVCT
jgi:hypothetical protein